MATYNFKTWQTINLDAVANDTQFIILDHTSSTPQSETSGVVYSGNILAGFGLQNLNEIFAQYVKCIPLGTTPTVQEDTEYSKTFYIYYSTDDWTTSTSDTVTVTYDWTYDTDTPTQLSNPINNLLDKHQYLVYSYIEGSAKYNYVELLSNRFTQTPYEISTSVGTFKIDDTCYNYCIYYLNQRGGWDSLLFQGKTIQNDKLTRLSYKKNYVAQSTDFNKVDYLTTIQESWQLNTSFMDDINSEKIINIMSSNDLYLQDLSSTQLIPVNITNSTCEHKTFKNQNRKLYTYTIEVTASQPKYRI